MARRPKILRQRDRSGLYLLGGCGLLVAALLFGLSLLGGPAETASEANDASQDTTQQSSGSSEDTRAEEQAQREKAEREEQAEKEKAAEEKAAREQAAREKAEKEKAEREAAEAARAAEEAEAAEQAAVPSSSEMYLTVPKMGLYDDPVASGVDEATLMNGSGHAPTTGYPWQSGSNTYIASHVLGYEGTGSYMHFASLPSVTYGDQITITDANGTQYNYEVFEVLEVSIYELWVMDPTGEDIVSLQTCINPPAYDVRLVVRGKLMDTVPA